MLELENIDLRSDPAAASYVKTEIVDVAFARADGELASLEGPNRYRAGDALVSGSTGSRSFTPARGDRQALAELGFIVVTIDGMGTPGRSKTFQDHYYGAMGRDNTIPDQISGMMQLAQRIVVLHHGEAIAEGRPDEITRDRRVIDAYLGEEFVLAQA